MRTLRPTFGTVLAVVALAGVTAATALPAGATTSPTTAAGQPAFDLGAARAALVRLVPSRHLQVELRALPRGLGGDRFRVSGRTGRILVEGTSPAVLLTGFDWYLKNIAHADVSWTGRQLRLPARLPAVPAAVTREANVPHRFAFNDTNEGYTGAYRTWAEWERQIDVLALHGINEVLVYVGADAVYYDTFREFGYSDAELRSWIPAPGHQPWWLLQNMSGFGGPVSGRLIADRAALGRKIVDRLRRLGMTPVLPGYFGTVPPSFTAKNPGARVVPQGTWVGFARPDWLDPRNPYFARVAEAFYRNQRERFGDTTMYKMDLLHEGGNPGDVPIGEAATSVETALRTAHPDAIWAILGWQVNPRRQILTAVDRTRMLILDGLSDRFPTVTDRDADWLGTPYAFGSIWNFGGHTAIGANAPDWVSLYPQWRDRPGSALAGTAMMPEAADNNPAALELFTELAWTPATIDLDTWFARFAWSRYGTVGAAGAGGGDPHAVAAWRVLRRTAYNMTRADSWSEAPDGLFGARPSLTATSAAAWSPPRPRYDLVAFDQALTELLGVHPSLRNSSAYRYDLVDVARQALSNHSRLLLPQLKAAHDAKDQRRFGELSARWLRWMRLMDDVLATSDRHLLGRWLAAARSWGGSDAERARLEYDARSLISTWGGRAASEAGLHDYANREWSGMVGGLYLRRWKAYLDELGAALRENRPPRTIDWFALEDAWAHGTERYRTRPSGDSYRAAQRVQAALSTTGMRVG
jgi:alpha-N-acetylglucosaminidase